MLTSLVTFAAFWSFGYTLTDLIVKIADRNKSGAYDEHLYRNSGHSGPNE